MKKKVFALNILFIIILLTMSFAITAVNDSSGQITVGNGSNTATGNEKVDKAYQCLENKVEDKCSSLSLEEAIFSLLAIGKCKEQVIAKSNNEKCWPNSNCDIKTTAQAIFALSKAGSSTSEAEEWLVSQNSTPKDIVWYLQIEASGASKCKITYSGATHTINIGEDKKISSSAGSCLSLAQGNYWLKIADGCYSNQFEISCDKGFSTNLLYKKKTGETIYVPESISSASAEGTTTEEINSVCFGKTSCNYEGSLWAALVLDYQGEDIGAFIPYLITMADESANEPYLPDSFLYALTGYTEFYSNLKSKQLSGYWEESGDKFYDTALALLALQQDSSQEKTNALDWLLSVQDNDGCWKGNIRNTAFILYAGWPKTTIGPSPSMNCEGAGYCISSFTCTSAEVSGTILEQYDCAGTSKCCSKQAPVQTCLSKAGTICNSNQQCSGTSITASDLSTGQTCCSLGTCQTIPTPPPTECVTNDGTCIYSCGDDEEQTEFDCGDSGTDICCIKKTPGINYLWIILFSVLIILVILGIIFREKLRPYWFRLKSMFKKSSSSGAPSGSAANWPGPRMPPSGGFPQRIMPRRILPQQMQQVRRLIPSAKPKSKEESDFSEVLKKLKEIGK